MKFESMEKARQYAAIQTIITGRKHKAMASRYFDTNKWDFVKIFTVILVK